jgi:anthranilate synthase component II
MILLIDNYDSFSYNVYQYVASLGHAVRVARNDKITVENIAVDGYTAIIISPGPGRPEDAGISKAAIARFAGQIPILGICLGHQAIGEVFGGRVVRAPEPVHGKQALVYHGGDGIYRELPQPLLAGRYHSLAIDRGSLPDCLTVTASSEDGVIMGVRHRQYNVEGVQFHPESILTPGGIRLLANFLASVAA